MDNYRIEWRDALSIGNESVDSQHRRLIEQIAAIPEYATERDGDVMIGALEYAVAHFAEEEAFMESIGYPDLAPHKAQHKKLTVILTAHHRKYLEGVADLYSFKQFMFRWVRDHIMDDDRRIGEYLRSLKRDAA